MSVLALDIGSSRIKALLAAWEGRIVETSSTATPTQTIEPGEQSYDAAEVLGAIEDLVTRLASGHPADPIDTIVFSCLGTAMIPLDAEGLPLGRALAPADTRPQEQPWRLGDLALDEAQLRWRTGSDPAVASFLLHALWWQRERPDLMGRLDRFRSLRGFALAQLCGADAEDRSWASRTMLVDLEMNDWSPEIVAAAGLRPDVLPPLEAPTATYPILEAAAERLGLAHGAVAVLGAMDNCCSHFGAAGPDRSGLVNIVGTYEHLAATADLEAVRAVASAGDAIVHSYLFPGQYIAMTRVPIGELLRSAAAGHEGGLDPLLDAVSPEPQGHFIQLDAAAVTVAVRGGTPRPDIVQRLIESATSVLARFAAAWAELGRPTEPIAIVGGGAGRDAVLRLKANLLDRRLVTLGSDEGAGLGALRLAAMAVKGATPEEACQLFENPITRTIQPHQVAPAT